MSDLDILRYPIGPAPRKDVKLTEAGRAAAIATIRELPTRLALATRGFTEQQFETPYRPGGWTVRQLLHHVADSHVNAYTRIRLALTEDFPTIKPYEEARWAELADARSAPVELSLTLLNALHARWSLLLDSVSAEDFVNRGYNHPEQGRSTLEWVLALYQWHSLHHTAHITALRQREHW
jgi:hypothetical protein